MKKYKILLGLFFCGTLLSCEAQKQEGVTAVSTNDFLNSLGVNSAIDSRGENIDKTIECVRYLGVRWIRSGYEDETTIENYKRLYKEGNAKVSYGLLSGGNDIPRLINKAKEIAAIDALLAIEGNNEPNNWGIQYENEKGGANHSWMAVAKLQRDLYKAVKEDAVLKSYPVWSISENGAQTDNVGLQYLTIPANAGTLMPAGTIYADYANCHNYITHPAWPGIHNNQTWLCASPGKDCQIDGLYGNYGTTWREKFSGYPEKELETLPKVTTETGVTIDGIITEELQARLYLSLYLSQFKRGWEHTAVYILRDRSDEEGNQTFGFYTPDYTPRKAAFYLHNLTTILADKESLKSPGKIGYTIPCQPETVHDLLMQKSNGKFYLVIWGERYEGGEDNIEIKFADKCKAINLYNPISGTAKIQTLKNVNTLSLVLTNHPYILEIEK